jgi:hypothetical protein
VIFELDSKLVVDSMHHTAMNETEFRAIREFSRLLVLSCFNSHVNFTQDKTT